MTAGQLVAIIITVAGFLVVLAFILILNSDDDRNEIELLCKGSINLRAASTIQAGSADVALAPPLCKTVDLEVTGNREEIKEQLAYAMARCWWMFGEGQYEQNLDDFSLFRETMGLSNSQNSCFLCYTAVIDQKEIEGGTIGAYEMFNYLIDTDHKDIKGLTYLDYIQTEGGPGQAVVTNDVAAKQAYGIIYMAKNKEGDGSAWWRMATVVGVGTGVVLCSVATLGTCAAVAAGAAIGAGTTTGLVDYFNPSERDVSVITMGNMNLISAAECNGDLAGN